jgi:hypothetical protein
MKRRAANMEYIPITHKFVAVLNRKIPAGNLMNALGHATAGLVAAYSELTELRFADYADKDSGIHQSISDNPFIVLQADNSNKLRSLRKVLAESEVCFVDFTSAMTVGTYVEQHERMRQTAEVELEYYALVMFGPIEKIEPLTKKFSLWRG